VIRKADYKDLDGVLAAIQDAKDLFKSKNSLQWQDTDGYPNRKTMEKDVADGALYVSVIDGIIAAVCSLGRFGEPTYDRIYEGQWLNDCPYYVIHRLAVKKEFYGRGLAKAILDHLEGISLSEGIFDLRCDTAAENQPMNDLLIDRGYKKCGVIYLTRPDVLEKKRIAYHKTSH